MKTKTIGLVLVLCAAPMGCTKADSEAVNKTTADSKQPVTATQPAPGAMVSAEAASPQDGPAGAGQISITSKSPEAVALFREGRDLKDNFRQKEAREKLNKAIELDPEFALAHAHLAQMAMDSTEREEHIAKARAAAGSLPKAESLLVEYLSLFAEGKAERSDKRIQEMTQKLVELAPGDWSVQIMAAQSAHGEHNIDGAIAAYERAIALNPKVAQPHNNLAYLYAERKDLERALKSIDRYAELESGPNPYDSKGEILLMNGKFEDSEAAFQKAADMDPSFVLAYEGIALTRMYRGDTAGGLEALDKAREVASDKEKNEVDYAAVWALTAAGQSKQAYARIDQVTGAMTGKDKELASVHGALLRAEVAFELGDIKRASKEAKKALEAGAASKHEMGNAKARWAYVVQLDVALAENNIAAAEKVLATIDAKAIDDDHFKAAVDYAHGAVAAAKADFATAESHFSKLPAKWTLELKARKHLANGLAKAGKKSEAAKVRAEMASDYRRDFQAVAVLKKGRTDS